MNTDSVLVNANGRWGGLAFRVALFAAAASLAAYIPYKYATQLHAVSGLYAFLFPLSGVLALAGTVLAVRPQTGCECSPLMRAGAGGLAVLWLATGLLCVPSLMEGILQSPGGGSFALFHMLAQHVFLALSVFAFAIAPGWMTLRLGTGKLKQSAYARVAAAGIDTR